MQTSAQFYKDNVSDLYIETNSGNRFYIAHPEFDITDIAHSLARQCRFTGHTSRFYSIAEHSVLVRNIMRYFDLGNPFEGLMHDAQEAYLADIASPWKVLLPDYKTLEKRVEVPLRTWAGLPEQMSEGCKLADWIALYVEAWFFIPSKAKDWPCPDGVVEKAADFRKNGLAHRLGWDSHTAQNRFLEVYYNAKQLPL